MEKKLQDESEEVKKLFESFCCKYPVTPDSESQPSSFKVKTRPEDGEVDRCVACTFESEDIKKVKRHWDGTITGLATVQIVMAIFLKRISYQEVL